eukprot:gene20241-24234_t
MDVADIVVKPVQNFAKESIRLVKRCTKPDRKEFMKISFRTALGFVVLGFIGFFVKLIFIPMYVPALRKRHPFYCGFPKHVKFVPYVLNSALFSAANI